MSARPAPDDSLRTPLRTTKYAAAFLSVSPDRILDLVHAGDLVAVDVSTSRRLPTPGESRGDSPNTFVARVVKSGIVTLVRERRRHKRQPTLPQRSLAEPVIATETTSLADVLTQFDADRRLGNATTSESQTFIDQDAVAVALQSVDPQVRQLFERLESGSVAVVAKHLGLSRHQRRRLLAASKPAFVQAGFEEFTIAPTVPSPTAYVSD